jgi:DNA helicase II / ATP-dependent DNA helicase PcrA
MNCERQQFDTVAGVICGKPTNETSEECFAKRRDGLFCCGGHDRCRLADMTNEQHGYVLHPLEVESYLKACPGSGKTESIALKAAYTLRAQEWSFAGIAFLTFTNNAADVVEKRVRLTHGDKIYPHFIGTFDSWLHGYILNPFGYRETKYPGDNGDRSISAIDSHSSSLFLRVYKTEPGFVQGAPILAHQFSYEVPTNNITFDSGSRGLDESRRNLVWTSAQLDEFKRIKDAFWKAGFVTHADVQTICYRVLHASSDLRGLVAKRFPFVVVDECQDLSPCQLCLLDELRKAGTKVHFVGDLNQAIFSFRKSDPKLVHDFVDRRSFALLSLSTNFRSVQPIVETCGRIVTHGPVTGRAYDGKDPACVYFIYDNEAVLPKLVERFEAFARLRKIDPAKCLILGRGNALVTQLGVGALPTNAAHCFAHAIYLWKTGAFEHRDEALGWMGDIIANNFFPGEPTNARNHDCPRSYASTIAWRIFLARILDRCVSNGRVSDFSQTWTKWAAVAKSELVSIVELVSAQSRPGVELTFRAPDKLGDQSVNSVFANFAKPNPEAIKILTIHSAKGETADAVLVVSAKDRHSKGGHWQQWLDQNKDDGEHARFAYVASSRPRQLLAWAVPKLSKGDAECLTTLGFQYIP